MNTIPLLPLAIMGLTAVVSLFIPRGSFKYRFWGLVVFAIACAAIFADSNWWRFWFCFGVCICCNRRPMYRETEKNLDPVPVWMGIIMMAMIISHAVIHCLFGWNSFIVLFILSLIGAFEYVWHLKDF